MENKKQAIILSGVAIVALLALIIGATYAYFRASGNSGSNTDINVTTYTLDLLSFEMGSDIKINADQTSFASGKGNATGSTFAKAILTANNKTNTATKNYYMYLNISNNTFTYTQNENTPELLLTITDVSGNAITSITGLTYKTVIDGKGTSVSGFDITTKSGLLTLFDNREITASPTKTEEWNVTVTFVNYNVNQTGNAGKSFNAKLMIQQEEYELTLADICAGKTLSDCVISQYTGTQGDNALYYHNSTLTNGAGDNSYRYAGGDYVLTEAGKATGATMMIGYNNSVTTALIDFYCNGTKQYVGYASSCSTSHYYLIKGDTTQYQTYNEALNASVEKGYLTKDNVKNFVCFGSDATTCPTENLYRIIGVFNNHVKLIKYDYAKSSLLGTDGDFSQEYTSNYFSGEQGESPSSNSLYYWNNAGTNTWSASKLNTVNLNTNFTTNIGTAWANKIATTTWKVGGGTYANLRDAVPKTAYQYEVGSSASTTTYDAKIGLMYVSDYYYSASPSAWTLVGYNSDYTKSYASAKGENWLYGGGWDWTISRFSDYSYTALYVTSYGYVNYSIVHNSFNGVRPSFSLLSSTTYVSGSGSMSDPVRIN
mgnify:CR=1 FL=1